MNAVLEALGRLAVSKTGKMKAKFGALLADPALAEMGSEQTAATVKMVIGAVSFFLGGG